MIFEVRIVNVFIIRLATAWMLLLLSLFSSDLFAARATTPTTVTIRQTLSDAELYGGCMARLSYNTSGLGLSCGTLVTFDCFNSLGTTTKSAAERNFNQAQLAMVASRYVRVVVDDSKKVNGQCFAERLDVLGAVP